MCSLGSKSGHYYLIGLDDHNVVESGVDAGLLVVLVEVLFVAVALVPLLV